LKEDGASFALATTTEIVELSGVRKATLSNGSPVSAAQPPAAHLTPYPRTASKSAYEAANPGPEVAKTVAPGGANLETYKKKN
jgi:hypothetical protein